MRELKATKINAADFAPFGTFFSMTEPEGYPLQGEIHKFYPDRISGTCMGSIVFHLLQYIKMNASLKLLNITQLPGKELLHWMMT